MAVQIPRHCIFFLVIHLRLVFCKSLYASSNTFLLSLKKNYFHVHEYFASLSNCALFMCLVPLDPLGLGLQMIVSLHVSAGN